MKSEKPSKRFNMGGQEDQMTTHRNWKLQKPWDWSISRDLERGIIKKRRCHCQKKFSVCLLIVVCIEQEDRWVISLSSCWGPWCREWESKYERKLYQQNNSISLLSGIRSLIFTLRMVLKRFIEVAVDLYLSVSLTTWKNSTGRNMTSYLWFQAELM